MSTLLRIDSSVRTHGSVSRQLTDAFISTWKHAYPEDRIIERDLGANPAPHLTEQVLGALVTPFDQRSDAQASEATLADELVQELVAADVLVIGAPMYNFSISSALKAWIDHVARAGVTFRYTQQGPVGLLGGKKAYVFTARGGIYSQGPGKAMDFQETYLRSVLGFIGITDTTFVHTEGLALGDPTAIRAMASSRAAVAELLAAKSGRAVLDLT